jgi:hypothetical protein
MSLASDIVQAQADFARLHRFIHGPTTETIQTEGGPLPSLSKVVSDAIATLASGLVATSTTGVVVGLGTRTFQIVAGKAFKPGQWVTAVSGGSFISGVVVSYSGTTLVITSSRSEGSGTLNTWTIAHSGAPGKDGPPGADGDGGTGGGTLDVLITKFPWE